MRNIPMLILLTLSLTGCADKKNPTDDNFRDALNKSLSQRRNCLVNNMSALPTTLPNNTRFNVLADAGLITKAPAPDNSGRFVYSLSPKGLDTETEAGYGPQPQKQYLCTGRLQVDKILNWTEPAEQSGEHTSRVTYTTKLVDVPAWAESPAVVAVWGHNEPTSTRPGSHQEEALVLTKIGWVPRSSL